MALGCSSAAATTERTVAVNRFSFGFYSNCPLLFSPFHSHIARSKAPCEQWTQEMERKSLCEDCCINIWLCYYLCACKWNVHLAFRRNVLSLFLPAIEIVTCKAIHQFTTRGVRSDLGRLSSCTRTTLRGFFWEHFYGPTLWPASIILKLLIGILIQRWRSIIL
jgi:hypothetical protein